MRKAIYSHCLIFIIAAIVFGSCRKDMNLSDEERSLVGNAKNWYRSSVGKDTKDKVRPIWTEAEVQISSDGKEMVIVPVSNENKSNNPKFDIITSFVFTGSGQRIYAGNIIQIVGTETFIKDHRNELITKYNDPFIKGFEEGAIITYDIDHKFLQGKAMKNGAATTTGAVLAGGKPLAENRITNSLATSGSQNVGLVNSKSPGKVTFGKDGPRIASTFGASGETDPGGGGGGGTTGGGGERYRGNCTDWYLVTYDTRTGMILSEMYLYTTCAPESEGGPPTTPPPTIIIDSLNGYPCAKSLLTQLPTLKNDIAAIVKSTFADNDNFNLKFIADPNLPAEIDGEARYMQGSPGVYFDATIALNTSMMNEATKEYILITMYHEVVHAYLAYEHSQDPAGFQTKYPKIKTYDVVSPNGRRTTKFDLSEDHQRFGPFIDKLKNAILSFNSQMPASTVDAMARMGIIAPSALTNDQKLLNGYERKVADGNYKGTKCP